MFKFVAKLGFLATIFVQPAFAQEREWLLDAVEEDVFLVFGVPNTNDVGVSFWCKINTGVVSVFAPLLPSMEPPKTLNLSTENASYELRTDGSQGKNSKTVEAKLKPQATILAELKSAERFTLILNKHKAVYPLAGADFDGLLKLCAPLP